MSRPLQLSRSIRMGVAVLAAVGVTLTGALQPSSAAGVKSAKTGVKVAVASGEVVAIDGRGFGHGRGMSQYGAQGAARQGLTVNQILAFYYPGTTVERHLGKLKVLITADTTSDTIVHTRGGLVVRNPSKSAVWEVAKLRPTATQWRVRPLAGDKASISFRVGSGKWKRLAKTAGDLEFYAGGRPLTLVLPSGTAQYRGIIRNVQTPTGDRDTLNVIKVENYLRGVVASEMPSSWRPAALQSQSVAARTYAIHARTSAPSSRHYEICDSTMCQVYKGVAGEVDSTDAAIKATKGMTLMYGGKPAFTQFSSSTGGWTVQGSVAYQKAKADPYDDWSGNPQRSWSTVTTPSRIEKAWPALGKLTAIEVDRRDGNGQWGGRVLTMKLTGSKKSLTIEGTAFRSALGLKSTYFNLEVGTAAALKKR